MKLGSIIPRSLVRYYYNLKASKGHKGIGIANDVDLRNVKLANYVNFAHHAQASNSSIGERTSIGRYSKIAENEKRNEIIISCLEIGTGLRQISRLTGVTYGVINKLNKSREGDQGT